MEFELRELIERLSNRKKRELSCFIRFKEDDIKDLMLISSGKLMELDHVISELKVMMKNKSKRKIY
ncbi:MAG: hypothetical protein JZU47_05110 [Prolixibacteraceae bacterium]|nr:hypothetical protein [Prolixibacteraceae bacterium]